MVLLAFSRWQHAVFWIIATILLQWTVSRFYNSHSKSTCTNWCKLLIDFAFLARLGNLRLLVLLAHIACEPRNTTRLYSTGKLRTEATLFLMQRELFGDTPGGAVSWVVTQAGILIHRTSRRCPPFLSTSGQRSLGLESALSSCRTRTSCKALQVCPRDDQKALSGHLRAILFSASYFFSEEPICRCR